MPEVYLTGIGSNNTLAAVARLKQHLIAVIARALPCKPETVTPRWLAEADGPEYNQNVVAIVITGFLNGKPVEVSQESVTRVRAAVEAAIKTDLSYVGHAECYLVASLPGKPASPPKTP